MEPAGGDSMMKRADRLMQKIEELEALVAREEEEARRFATVKVAEALAVKEKEEHMVIPSPSRPLCPQEDNI